MRINRGSFGHKMQCPGRFLEKRSMKGTLKNDQHPNTCNQNHLHLNEKCPEKLRAFFRIARSSRDMLITSNNTAKREIIRRTLRYWCGFKQILQHECTTLRVPLAFLVALDISVPPNQPLRLTCMPRPKSKALWPRMLKPA